MSTGIANRWGVPPTLLYGVYGLETSFGKNITTSSAGAIGGFQFLPSTAKPYAYPLTNTPTKAQAAAQADSAAHYLHDLYQQYGSWDAALRHYSGGGYGYKAVMQAAGSGAGFIKAAATPDPAPVQAVKDAANAAAGAVDSAAAVGAFLGKLSDPATWLRVLEGIAGLILLVVALRQFASAASGGGVVGPPHPSARALAVAA